MTFSLAFFLENNFFFLIKKKLYPEVFYSKTKITQKKSFCRQFVIFFVKVFKPLKITSIFFLNFF